MSVDPTCTRSYCTYCWMLDKIICAIYIWMRRCDILNKHSLALVFNRDFNTLLSVLDCGAEQKSVKAKLIRKIKVQSFYGPLNKPNKNVPSLQVT